MLVKVRFDPFWDKDICHKILELVFWTLSWFLFCLNLEFQTLQNQCLSQWFCFHAFPWSDASWNFQNWKICHTLYREQHHVMFLPFHRPSCVISFMIESLNQIISMMSNSLCNLILESNHVYLYQKFALNLLFEKIMLYWSSIYSNFLKNHFYSNQNPAHFTNTSNLHAILILLTQNHVGLLLNRNTWSIDTSIFPV